MTQESDPIIPGSREEMRFLRKHSNWVNMVIAILACLGVVVVALLMAPQPEVDSERVVDYKAVAESAQANVDFPLIVPTIPKGWKSNEATFDRVSDSETLSWYVSFLGEQQQWVSIEQARASEHWVTMRLGDDAVSAETVDVSGVTFQIYRADATREYWVASKGDVYVIIKATATPETIDYFARQVAEQLR